MARMTLRASTLGPPVIETVCVGSPSTTSATSRVRRNVAPKTHACWYARCASSAPERPREKPR